jgi:hypothetical protein
MSNLNGHLMDSGVCLNPHEAITGKYTGCVPMELISSFWLTALLTVHHLSGHPMPSGLFSSQRAMVRMKSTGCVPMEQSNSNSLTIWVLVTLNGHPMGSGSFLRRRVCVECVQMGRMYNASPPIKQ